MEYISHWLDYDLAIPAEHHYQSVPEQYKLFDPRIDETAAECTLTFALPGKERVELTINDLNGNIVATVFDGYKNPGIHQINCDISDLRCGKYFCVMSMKKYAAGVKIMLKR